jgi:short-subunit dehydrogenase
MNFQDTVFVVTGAASGIGRALTTELLLKGSEVAMVDLNEANLNATLNTMPDILKVKISLHLVDISDEESIAMLPHKIIEKHRQIDGIINNAGIIQPFKSVEKLTIPEMERIMNVNWWGTVYMVHYFLPILKTRPDAYIVNVASMGGFISFPGQTLYSASKAAVKILTEGLHSELSNSNIHVTLALPGAVNTNIMENSGVTISPINNEKSKKSTIPMLQADKAAKIIVHAIERHKFRVLVGRDAWLLDKLYTLGPTWATGFIAKQMSKRN